MSVYNQIAHLPIIFQVGEGKLHQTDEIISSKNLNFREILVLSGNTFSADIANKLKSDRISRHEILKNSTFEEVNRLSEIIYKNNFDLIIGIGGGKIIDVAKRLSLNMHINHLYIPTIISNDGLISPISVLTDDQGYTKSLPGNMPMGVIIDLDIISKSPLKYLKAAAGDILSNMSATNDWFYAYTMKQERINDIGFQLSRMAAHSLINFKDSDLNSKDFLKCIIQGQVNSGIAMALSGTSRPCSGSEHLLSHAIDYLGISENTLHGYQVGVLSLFCLYLQNKLKPIHLEYADNLKLDKDFLFSRNLDEKFILEIFHVSRKMRPGRVTILDEYNDKELLLKYEEYINYIEI
jgi:glycerol-1-phosphate dehydrogenase [NAD(P)+]